MHTLRTEQTARGRRIAAGLTQAHLEEIGLPEVEWRTTRQGELYGHIDMPGRDHEARRAIDEYANFLRGTVTSKDHDNGTVAWTHLYVAAMYRGVAVGVWTHVGHHPVSRTDVA
jgi:hypothetical protein